MISRKNRITLVINKCGMGEAPDELSHVLLKNYLSLILLEKDLPSYICFYADGAKLTTDDSPVIDVLKELEDKGVNILICRTCLNFYGIINDVKVGTIATMEDIIGAQYNSDKVIVL